MKDYEEIYLTKDGMLFLRSRGRYNSEVAEVEDNTDWRKKIETNFVFKRFS